MGAHPVAPEVHRRPLGELAPARGGSGRLLTVLGGLSHWAPAFFCWAKVPFGYMDHMGYLWKMDPGWWFGTFFIFPYIWNDHPI